MIDLTIDKKTLDSNIKYCREKGITLPTFEMMKNPDLVPQKMKDKLKKCWTLGHQPCKPLQNYLEK